MIISKDKLVINFTPTGMIPTKVMTRHVPVSINEIVNDVLAACEIGITMVHLHARDEEGVPTSDIDIYGKIIGGIRAYNKELVICVSTSGRINNTLGYRTMPLGLSGDLKPDMGSLTLSSLNFNKEASINTPEVIMGLANEMKIRGIKPELEIFDLGMANYMKYLITKNLLISPYYVNIILGNIACGQSNLLHMGVLLNDLPNCVCSMGGIGEYQLSVNSMAISIGCGIRVGLEDNIWYDNNRTRLATNIDLIKRVHILANANERLVMTSNELRQRLGLRGDGYGI